MTEQEAIEFIFEVLRKTLIDHEGLTPEEREIIDYYEYHLNGFYKREE